MNYKFSKYLWVSLNDEVHGSGNGSRWLIVVREVSICGESWRCCGHKMRGCLNLLIGSCLGDNSCGLVHFEDTRNFLHDNRWGGRARGRGCRALKGLLLQDWMKIGSLPRLNFPIIHGTQWLVVGLEGSSNAHWSLCHGILRPLGPGLHGSMIFFCGLHRRRHQNCWQLQKFVKLNFPPKKHTPTTTW